MRANFTLLRRRLLQWFGENKRQMPWRDVKDPYLIWLSEVMLQQTRAAQAEPYYLRFIARFPDVNSLAAASEQEVLSLWQGLGYYSRGRNVHLTAKQIVEKFNGKFPEEYKTIRDLKGIGDYTASAILSLAFGKPYAVLDGNVYRVLSRLFAIDEPVNSSAAKKIYSRLAADLLDKKNPAAFNEAMMELGATLCSPKNPDCTACPLQAFCLAYSSGKQHSLPVKLKKGIVKKRYLHYFLVSDSKGLFLKKRVQNDIWKNLFDLPLIEKHNRKKPDEEEIHALLGKKASAIKFKSSQKHLLTHRELLISFYRSENWGHETKKKYTFVPFNRLQKYPLPRPIELFLKKELSQRKLLP